ncbi:MAG: tRNA adenosine(34) deaminase TadA [Desulfarculales bacterium]|jgi:tRNA(adenine34) deaminase|nr:tRNA adenosine(34) deaminase TadA [Desulfarculales bacterium]
MSDIETRLMSLALEQARQAGKAGEVPVGAVLADEQGEVIASASNRTIALCDPSAHAEILALRAGAEILHNYRLPNCILCVTLEPCPMCAGALIWARVKKVVFGANDSKAGALGSVLSLHKETRFNHRLEISSGVLAEQSIALLQNFFAMRRK